MDRQTEIELLALLDDMSKTIAGMKQDIAYLKEQLLQPKPPSLASTASSSSSSSKKKKA